MEDLALQIAAVDDIIVTAQKREQSLQDVPIVVTSLSAETLQDAGVRDIKDLQILTPGMTVTSTSSEASTTARIRGVGTVGDNPGLESSVGVVIDGVYRSRNSVGFGDLGEMSRIEVLKGPQGTLFGKNTSAGVINIITEAPSFTPEFGAELTVGNYGAMAASGSVSGPISDTLAFRTLAEHTPDTIARWTEAVGGQWFAPSVWLHPEWSQRANPAVLKAITDHIKAVGGAFRAGWQVHKPYSADALDVRARPPVPLGGDPAKGL